MYTHADKLAESKSNSAANSLSGQVLRNNTLQLQDNRAQSTMQKKMQEIANDGLVQSRSVIQLGKKGDKKTKYASKRDKDSREGARKAKYASTTGGGTTVFNNNEGKLKKPGKGQHYIETDVGKGHDDRGKRRIVSLVENGTGRVLKQYNTEDHYNTFK